MKNPPQPGGQPPQAPEIMHHVEGDRFVGAFALAEHQKGQEASLNTSLLQAGDVLAITYDADKNRAITFEVESSSWDALGAGNEPRVLLMGTLHGSNVSPDLTGRHVRLDGSTRGRSSIEYGVIATGRSPIFSLGKEGEIALQDLTDFGVYRRDAHGTMRQLGSNELAVESRRSLEVHRQRLAKVDQLKSLLGFDTYDLKDTSISSRKRDENGLGSGVETHENERYIASYSAGRAHGNQLSVLDKTTGEWLDMTYRSGDFLQLGYADLAGVDPKEMFDAPGYNELHVTDRAGVNRTGKAVTTRATSGGFGLNAINYHMSDTQAIEILKLPDRHGTIYSPGIQILEDGSVHVETHYPFSVEENAQPGLTKRVESMIQAKVQKNGDTTLMLGDQEVVLPDVDAVLDAMIASLQPERMRKLKQTLPKLRSFMRRTSP